MNRNTLKGPVGDFVDWTSLFGEEPDGSDIQRDTGRPFTSDTETTFALELGSGSSPATEFSQPSHEDGEGSHEQAASESEYIFFRQEPQEMKWERDSDTASLIPVWLSEPSTESIIGTLRLRMDPNALYTVEHWHTGTYNKFYLVQQCFIDYSQPCTSNYAGLDLSTNEFMLKITLPICPEAKTLSEVATLTWLSTETTIPTPRVRDYEASSENPIGYEWILMDFVRGYPLSKVWEDITLEQKLSIADQLADFTAQLYHKSSDEGIFSLYPGIPEKGDEADELRGGELAGMSFFWTETSTSDLDKGPFNTTFAWNKSRLDHAEVRIRERLTYLDDHSRHQLQDQETTTTRSETRNKLQRMLGIILQLQAHNRNLYRYPSGQYSIPPDKKERTILSHPNLSADNILLDPACLSLSSPLRITSILDWETAHFLPFPLATHLPSVLQQRLYSLGPHEPTTTDKKRLSNRDKGKFRLSKVEKECLLAMRKRQGEVSRMVMAAFRVEMNERSKSWWMTFYGSEHRQAFEAAVQEAETGDLGVLGLLERFLREYKEYRLFEEEEKKWGKRVRGSRRPIFPALHTWLMESVTEDIGVGGEENGEGAMGEIVDGGGEDKE